MHAELDALICSGARRGKQHTYALLDERAPDARDLPRDEALAELAGRYFTSHGPATARDFATWASLTLAEVRESLEAAGPSLRREDLDGVTLWSGAGETPRRRAEIARRCTSCRATTSTSWATPRPSTCSPGRGRLGRRRAAAVQSRRPAGRAGGRPLATHDQEGTGGRRGGAARPVRRRATVGPRGRSRQVRRVPRSAEAALRVVSASG